MKGAIRKTYGFTLDEICKIHRESKLHAVTTTPAWVFLLNLLKVSDRLRDDSLAEGVELRLWNCMVGLHTAGRHGEATDMLHGLKEIRVRPNVINMIVEAARLMPPHIQVLENQALYDFLIDNPDVRNAVLERGD